MLKPAIISSFCTTGVEQAVKLCWPIEISNAEVYAFMQGDIVPFFRRHLQMFPALNRQNAVGALAQSFENLSVIRNVAERLDAVFSGKRIVAFATFLPEIMSHEENFLTVQQACDALKFLVKLARVLQEKGHPIRTIEIVGGSRVDGVWRGRRRDNQKSEIYMVNQLSPGQAIARLLKRLQNVAFEAIKPPTINLALELEPGPLFVLNGTASLKLLVQQLKLKQNAAVAEILGLNLDIPHWAFLSDVSLDWAADPKNGIRNRIVHAHISDHAKGHFSDSAIFSHNAIEQFRPWIGFLKAIEMENGNFSGYVSCELEACRDSSILKQSSEHLLQLLK